MRFTPTRRLLSIVTSATLAGVSPGHAQTPATAAPPPATPTTPATAAESHEGDDLQWSGLGATAQCRDGAYFHGRPEARTCADHGGVGKWLDDPGQALIR